MPQKASRVPWADTVEVDKCCDSAWAGPEVGEWTGELPLLWVCQTEDLWDVQLVPRLPRLTPGNQRLQTRSGSNQTSSIFHHTSEATVLFSPLTTRCDHFANHWALHTGHSCFEAHRPLDDTFGGHFGTNQGAPEKKTGHTTLYRLKHPCWRFRPLWIVGSSLRPYPPSWQE